MALKKLPYQVREKDRQREIAADLDDYHNFFGDSDELDQWSEYEFGRAEFEGRDEGANFFFVYDIPVIFSDHELDDCAMRA